MRLSICKAPILVCTLVLPSVLCLEAYAQQPVTAGASDPHAITLLTAAAAAIGGTVSVSDVTLSGAARRVAGSDDEVGTAVLKAVGTNTSVILNLPSGIQSEVRSTTNGQSTGTWSGIDAVSHQISIQNTLTDPAWFFPLFAVSRGLASSGYVATYVGHETRGDVAVEHLTISQRFAGFPSDQAALQRLSQIDIYFDSNTLLPTAMTFSIHPDNNELVDIPIEVSFADYKVVSGVQVPLHVQKLLNNGLVLDLQFQNVTLNSGLTASQVVAQ
jgi:hypothetical protein